MKKTKADKALTAKKKNPLCWCGGTALEPFSDSYFRCNDCQTLVSKMPGRYDRVELDKKQADFYGKSYWVDYQQQELGFPAIAERARQDLSGRCLYWLKTILEYKLPAARALELGSSHGGFIALLGWAGFEATGIEINQWIIDFARRTFNVNLLLGDITAQQIQKNSMDIIILMDVLEHVTDPLKVITQCAGLLASDGIILIQTPDFPGGSDYPALQSADSPFLTHLHGQEHLYLFSRRSVLQLLQRAEIDHAVFEPALFAHYDMYLVAGRQPLKKNSRKRIEQALSRQPTGRAVLALCDLDSRLREADNKAEKTGQESRLRYEQIEKLTGQLRESEADRAERLKRMEELKKKLDETMQESRLRYEQIEKLTGQLRESEADRAERLKRMEELEKKLDETMQESRLRYEQIEKLTGQLRESEADRAERLKRMNELGTQLDKTMQESLLRYEQIEKLTGQLRESEADRAARLQQIEALGTRLHEVDRENKDRFLQIEKLQTSLRKSEKDNAKGTKEMQKLAKKPE
jgi:2-polyprenyl-3-methyl-5-hydroxy-6-metoxy-1,4-benzoquinol methylase